MKIRFRGGLPGLDHEYVVIDKIRDEHASVAIETDAVADALLVRVWVMERGEQLELRRAGREPADAAVLRAVMGEIEIDHVEFALRFTAGALIWLGEDAVAGERLALKQERVVRCGRAGDENKGEQARRDERPICAMWAGGHFELRLREISLQL